MPVDPRERDTMANFIAILNGEPSIATPSPAKVAPAVAERSDVDAMKSILESFYRATTGAAARLQDDAQIDRGVREALITERTPHGAKIGSWEIRVNEGTTKTYDVVHVHTEEDIASGLRLYEAAHALVKLLNQRVGINSMQVREVLALEERYSKHLSDAVVMAARMKRCLKESHHRDAAIAEDRYSEARAQALQARDKLRRMNERF